jgi:phosphate starvation-inducible PhoH-like protein
MAQQCCVARLKASYHARVQVLNTPSRHLAITLQPPDKQLLQNLCGPQDENLRHIEASFNVAIARRGWHLRISGNADLSTLAAELIQTLYTEAIEPLSLSVLQQKLIKMRRRPQESEDQPSALTDAEPDQIDVPHNVPQAHLQHTHAQAAFLKNIQTHDVTFGIGPAGAGKMALAISAAVDALARNEVKRIVLVRPSAEKFCCLSPRELARKINPYLRPFYDALHDLIGFEKTAKLCKKQQIEVSPLKYLQGRTLNHTFIVMDEAQNTTPQQMKMFLTRIGAGTKAVITGDINQIHLPGGEKSGLVEARQVLADVPGLAFTDFSPDDVVYQPIVARIIKAYKKHASATS